MTDIEFFGAIEQPTVVARATGYPVDDLATLFDSTFTALFPALTRHGIGPAGAPFSLYTRLPDGTVDIEVGIPVATPLPAAIREGEVGLVPSVLPAGPAARTVHAGGYDGLAEAWQRFMGAVADAGRGPVFPFWEVYLTEPTPGADPDDMRTELVTLVAAP